MKRSIIFFLIICVNCFSDVSYEGIYKSLDPNSIAQHFAYYELYPDTELGKKALSRAWELLNVSTNVEEDFKFPSFDVYSIIHFVNKQPTDNSKTKLTESQLSFIQKISKNLSNRKLKTFGKTDIKDFLEAPPEEIDLARGLFIASMPDEIDKVDEYEASLDLMALQILAHLPKNATDIDKIHAINDFIFYQMRFRFPPHSIYSKQIDTYTFLPSVMDSRRGVCLGVSILYLCLAQRLDLKLEAVTPPGHIYCRYKKNDGEYINIETTARGIHIDSEEYMSMQIKGLETNNIKEVIGLSFMNIAALHWEKENNYKKAIELYEKAALFLPDYYLLQKFLGYNYVFSGDMKKGKVLLKKSQKNHPSYLIGKDAMLEDFLLRRIDIEGIKTIFIPVDETRKSIKEKQKVLLKTIKNHPQFRSGIFYLAGTYLQLGRLKEAKNILLKYEKVDPNDIIVNYYLALISYERMDYQNAWKYFFKTKSLLEEINYLPKLLDNFEQVLKRACPQPSN